MDFADRVLNWYDQHGRHDLPWQVRGDPYPVWIAEIMLQQTQVNTVKPYYEKFIQRFPSVSVLASADIDQVLHHWSGLGYYARARNLHRAAQQILSQHGGVFPQQFDDVLALPGIGRSTAGAILAQSFGQRHPILDGNVKRVLCRYYRVTGWPGHRETEKTLWQYSEKHTPAHRVDEYTQAIMDLGATLCTRGKPTCLLCPLKRGCLALRHGDISAYPASRPRKAIPVRTTTMLLLQDEQQKVCLVKRPATGIWGGLWSLPELAHQDPQAWATQNLALDISTRPAQPPLRHSFSHFHLDISVIPAKVTGMQSGYIMEKPSVVWYNPADNTELGLAAPIIQIIQTGTGAA